MRHRHRILVCDDEERVRDSLSGLLQDHDYEVVSSSSGKECLHVISTQPFDLAILDIVMPDLDGIEVLQRIKKRYKDLEVIMITGYADKEQAISTFRLKAYDFVEKPFESKELLNTVANCLKQIDLKRELEKKTQDLKASEKKYRSMMESIKDPVYICSPDYQVEYMNTAMIERTGRDARGEKCFKAIHDLEEKCPWCLNHKTPQGESFEQDIISPKDNRSYHVSHFPNINGDGSFSKVTVFRDTTELKKIEAQLIQSQKMEAVGTLAGGVAHDFNNLLTTILGNAELGLMDLAKDNPANQNFKEIIKAGKSATSLTRQLLAFSRKQILQPVILNLNKVTANIEKMLQRMIGEDLDLITLLEPNLDNVMADPGQMEQIIMNLVVNARDAMPLGGKITIETANVNLDKTYFLHQKVASDPGPYVMLSISDTGKGMDKKTQSRIFEPFFTTKEKGRGTGLGLSTVYGIVKQNNGYIWAYSEPEKGTTFKVYLPWAKGDEVLPQKEKTFTSQLTGSETILIAEDDDSLRNFAQKVLKRQGYKVLEAENGEDALRIANEYQGPIELMLTDVVMPKMNGKETAERIQPLYPQMKVIYMSGYTDNSIAHYGILAPEVNFLEKPFTPEVLTRKVREVLDKSACKT
jgi:two-component system cell cycle sensor histidine kinase/response regulator CckA